MELTMDMDIVHEKRIQLYYDELRDNMYKYSKRSQKKFMNERPHLAFLMH